MILSTLLRPPAAPPEEKAPETKRPASGALDGFHRRSRRYDRAIFIGVMLSVAAHVLFVFGSRLIVGYFEPNYDALPAAVPRRLRVEGMRAVEVRVTETAEAEPERVVPRQPLPQPEAPVEAVEAVPRLSAAERLRPRVLDLRLWLVPMIVPSRVDMTPEERAAELRQRLYAYLEAYDDSVAEALAREAESMDWTVGEEGNKWGVSPGKIHLGGVTLPLPFYFGPTREEAETMREWGEIRRQAGQAGIDEAFKERIEAIRRQKAAEAEEAEEAQKDTTSGGGGG